MTGRRVAPALAALLLGVAGGGRATPAAERPVVTLADGAVAALPVAAGRTPPRLIVLLHGAGQDPRALLHAVARDPACAPAVLLAPRAGGATWDVVAMARRRAMADLSLASGTLRYRASPDADRVGAAMAELARHVATDPARTLLLGFSDGASFALALGAARDRPFAGVVAVAPGLVALPARPAAGRPVLVMHGTRDRTLPFEVTRATIVPALRGARLAVSFAPFAGDHAVPPQTCTLVVQRFGG